MRAIELNPSLSYAYGQLGHILVRQGRAREGLEHIRYAIRLSPRDPSLGFWYFFAGEAALEIGDNEGARDWLLQSLAALPNGNPLAHGWLAATYALMGRTEDASRHAEEFRKIVPEPRIAVLLKGMKRAADRSQRRRIAEGFTLAFAPSQ